MSDSEFIFITDCVVCMTGTGKNELLIFIKKNYISNSIMRLSNSLEFLCGIRCEYYAI